ncbi:hypothetical protein PYCC9005_003620 [Savitreella phatthalungensis]
MVAVGRMAVTGEKAGDGGSTGTSELSKRKRKAAASWSGSKKQRKGAEDAALGKAAVSAEASTDVGIVDPVTGESVEVRRQAQQEKQAAAAAAKSAANANKRYTLFVGNLSYDTTAEDLKALFDPFCDGYVAEKPAGEDGERPKKRGKKGGDASALSSVRLATDAKTGKPKGFCFVDLPSGRSLDRCLNLHHTDFKGRKINVELTAGGGGTGEKRKNKIASKNAKLKEERDKAREEKASKPKIPPPPSKKRANGSAAQPAESNATAERDQFADINPARLHLMRKK